MIYAGKELLSNLTWHGQIENNMIFFLQTYTPYIVKDAFF